jgi:uncharacterized repeat protein (TIGR03803 family)
MMLRNSYLSLYATLAALGGLNCTANAAPVAGLRALYSFSAIPDGALPSGGPLFSRGTLYGVTNSGGTTDSGAVYAVDAKTGTENILFSFANSPDGSGPAGELIEHDGLLLGTTALGGASGGGTAFAIDLTAHTESILHDFGSGSDGAMPGAGMIYYAGRFFGTTTGGGNAGNGTVYSIDAKSGDEKVLCNFAGGSDGATPFAGLLVLKGALYGTTFFGGPANNGTVFKVDPKTGAETVLHAFSGGSFHGNPAATLIYANGLLYGTTAHSPGGSCGGNGCGTVFSTDPGSGVTNTIYTFVNQKDGEDPEGRLVALSGLLYGTTETGGKSGLGTLFQLDPKSGLEAKLHDFNGVPDGQNPLSLTTHGGVIYGAAINDGNGGFGTVFRLMP